MRGLFARHNPHNHGSRRILEKLGLRHTHDELMPQTGLEHPCYLLPGKRLFLLSTGTGLAPFMSIVRDPDTYNKFEQIVLVHGVRQVDELAYHDLLTRHLPEHEVLGELVTSQLRYYPTVTRETYHTMGRVTELMDTGKLFADLKMPALDAANDRVMMCGSPAMLRDLKHMLEKRGFREGNTSTPGDFVIERAFAEQ